MPLYEYECTQCKRHTEKIQKFSDPEITQCPHCGGKLERVLSAPAVSFKGGGWYADGYGSPKPAETKSDAKPAKSEAGTSISASSDAPSSSKETSSTPAPAAPAPAAPAASTPEKK
ncbi:MAG TPA: zinc ribbon domain-containing protein [Acidobacteriaceae bacterium]|nr:zinc ribbon domain-containing protein [Acidobacteriaceae bacterium]